jgi:signal transduction histidine kinase
MRLSLRVRLFLALFAVVVATVALAGWAVNERIKAGARREADAQARAQTDQARALYAERAGTLLAEGEAVSLYPAVIAALAGENAAPLLQWSGEVTALQGTRVTVVNAAGRVIARGHAPEMAGDDLAAKLEGLRLALTGRKVSGVEAGDEIGLAVRGYAPVRRDFRTGAVIGAVMIADPLDERLLARLAGSEKRVRDLRVEEGGDGEETCATAPDDGSATCRFPMLSPAGAPAAGLALTVPLDDIRRARRDTQRTLWLTGGLVLLLALPGAWLLARSLTAPLARLTASAHRIAGGDYDEPVRPGGRDEIGTLAAAFETMRERVRAVTGILRHERDVLNAVLESTGDGILMTAPDGTPLVGNRRWTELLGGAGLEAAADLRRVGGGEDFAQAVRGWLADPERVAAGDFKRPDPYGRFRCYTAPVVDLGGGNDGARRTAADPNRDGGTAAPHAGARDRPLLGRIFVMRDVTRETEAERMRSALVSTVSHELRSPLAAITGYTDTVLHGGPWDAETEREFLEIVAASAEKLSRLVDNLLDAAKMEAGVLRLEREPVRVERIAERVVAHRRALTPDHPLTVEAEAGLPLADADPMRVEQVITNLVENAIKYSPAGGPITVRVTGGAAITVSVSDRGVGIAPEHAERLFERFYRAEGDLTRTTKGVGLGLYICRSLVEAHGGRIWVESTPGQGSTFTFTLPVLTERVADGPGTPAGAAADPSPCPPAQNARPSAFLPPRERTDP